METLYQTIGQSGISIPFEIIQRYGLKQGTGVRIELHKDMIHITPAEVDVEEIENRALRYLLKHVGDAVVIEPAQRTVAGDWIVPVLASTGAGIGKLHYTPDGKLVANRSTPPQILSGDGHVA